MTKSNLQCYPESRSNLPFLLVSCVSNIKKATENYLFNVLCILYREPWFFPPLLSAWRGFLPGPEGGQSIKAEKHLKFSDSYNKHRRTTFCSKWRLSFLSSLFYQVFVSLKRTLVFECYLVNADFTWTK